MVSFQYIKYKYIIHKVVLYCTTPKILFSENKKHNHII